LLFPKDSTAVPTAFALTNTVQARHSDQCSSNRTPTSSQLKSPKYDGQYNNQQNDRHDQQQTACFITGRLLISTRTSQLNVGAPCISQGVLNIDIDCINHVTLISDKMSDISEEFIQFSHGLFDLPDFPFSLDDEVLLEIHFVLLCQPGLFQRLELLLSFSRR